MNIGFNIIFGNLFINLSWNFSANLIIVNLAIYNDKPFPLKAKTIKIGITQESVVFFSMNIFFTAGSSNQAIEAVHPATIIDNIKDKKIFLRCFLT